MVALRGASMLLLLPALFVSQVAGVTERSSQLRERRAMAEALGAEVGAEENSKDTPIQRVIKLLKEMKAQLDKEVSGDAEMYDKMVCWCETNDKEKTKAIADADASIIDLESDSQTMAARKGELATKIEAMKAELVEKKAALKKATELREKEYAEFTAEEKEMMQATTMLKNAIIILGKHNAGLMQITPAIQESMGTTLRWVALKHEELLEMSLERTGLRGASRGTGSAASLLAVAASGKESASASAVDKAMLQALKGGKQHSQLPIEFGSRVLARAAGQAGSLVQTGQPVAAQSYAPQSGQIFGILKQMKEEFENDLSTSQKEEMKAAEEFAALKAASEKAIAAGAESLDEMEEEHAANTKALSDANEDLESTRETRAADVKFLRELKLKCQDLDREYAARSKARGLEVKAVAETIAILTDDDARTLFAKKMSFVQVRSRSSNSAAMRARGRAAAVLLQAARRLKRQPDLPALYQAWRSNDDKPHEKLAAMAVQVQLDAFTKVKKAIDDMVADLKAQQEAEVKKKEYCNTELDENEKMTYTTETKIADLKDKIAGLDATLEKLAEEIAAAKKEIADMQVAIKQASEDREKENAEFQEEITDQRTMQAILKKALDRMAAVYKSSFLQQSQEPPMKFQPMKQNAGSSPVIGLLEQIIEDSKKVETDAMTGEQESQKAYEEFVLNSNDSLAALNAAIAAKSDSTAEAKLAKSTAESELNSSEEELSDLQAYNGDLHAECDFVLKNFDIRQKARLQEIEALGNAKAYLSGMADDQ